MPQARRPGAAVTALSTLALQREHSLFEITVPGCSPCTAMSRTSLLPALKLRMRLSAPFLSHTPHRPLFTPLLPLLSCRPSTCNIQS